MSAYTGTAIEPAEGQPLVVIAEGRDRRTGKTITYGWHGREAEIRAKATEQYALGRRIEIRNDGDGGEWFLEATTGAAEDDDKDVPLSDVWELVGNSLEKRLWELPIIQAQFDRLTDDDGRDGVDRVQKINYVKRVIEAFIRGETTTKGLYADTQDFDLTANFLFGDNGDGGQMEFLGMEPQPFRQLADMMARGVEVFPLSQFVLRHTRIVADGSNIKPEIDDMLKARTTDSLKDAEEIPETLQFILPEGLWVKQVPTVQQTGADKWTIQEEWYHADRAEKAIYGEPI